MYAGCVLLLVIKLMVLQTSGVPSYWYAWWVFY